MQAQAGRRRRRLAPNAPSIFELLSRDELRAICRVAGLDDSGREKALIADHILGRADGNTATLTKAELTEAVAAAAGMNKRDAEIMVKAVLAAITESLRGGRSIRGFGSFRLRQRLARIGRNPKTGPEVQVPPKQICYFKPGKTLRLV